MSNRHRLTGSWNSRDVIDSRYAKEATDRNDIVSLIWGVIQQIKYINQTKTDLQTVEVADGDMIWVL